MVLGDAHGDGWNGAEAHIDAYTGFDQWTFVTTATWLDGAETHQDNANDEVKSVKSIGTEIRDSVPRANQIHFPFQVASRTAATRSISKTSVPSPEKCLFWVRTV